MRKTFLILVIALTAMCLLSSQRLAAAPVPAKIIFDTDIGDDIDDAYALALLLASPEVKIIGITTAYGDTRLRARLVTRLLADTGHADITVYAGPASPVKNGPTQAAFALQSPDQPYPDAIAFILDAIRKSPGEITLVSVAPLTNLGALLQEDPAAFRKLKRVVLMGGSIRKGYGEGSHTEPEWNIVCDIPAARALFTSGIPLFVMPLDSTQIMLDKARQGLLFARNSAMTRDLEELTHEWTAGSGYGSPTLYDAVAAAYAVEPFLCPATPMRIVVDEKGMTLAVAGKPNARVCLGSDADAFLGYYLHRVK